MVALVLGVILIFSLSGGSAKYENIKAFDGNIQVYKSESCSCCSLWYSYFKGKPSAKVGYNVVERMNPPREMDEIKDEYGIPKDLRSCHTTIIGKYFVEGHIPLSAIEKLLKEQPDIAGIAMPGMPSGSPGMPGTKVGDFVIYSVNHDGTYQEFMRI